MAETGLDSTQVELQKSATRSGSSLIWQLAFVAVLFSIVYFVYKTLQPPDTPLTRAITLINQSKAAAAIPVLEDLSKQHPNNAQVYPWLAKGYLFTDRIAEGRIALDTAMRLNADEKDVAPVVVAYLQFYESKGDYEEAEKLLNSAISPCPHETFNEERVSLFSKWAEQDAIKNNLADRIMHLEKALPLSRQVGEPMRSVIPHALAEAYRQNAALAEVKDKDDALAMTLLLKGLRVSDEPATRMALGQIYAKKAPEKAIEQYQKVVAVDINNLEARHRLIDLLLQTKNYPQAQVALLDLTDKEKSVENFQLLAAVNLKIDNFAGAARAYEEACDLRPKPELLKQLQSVLLDWSAELSRQRKPGEAASVKARADRVGEQLATLLKDDEDEDEKDADSALKKFDDGKVAPIALSFSKIWLAKGSLTPEGEIRIRNISGHPISELSLTAVFYDNTAHKQCGSVTLPIATPTSAPFAEGASKDLYFSSPNIVKTDHQLAAIITWKNHFLKEFPVVKQL